MPYLEVPHRFSGLGAGVKQEGWLQSYHGGEMRRILGAGWRERQRREEMDSIRTTQKAALRTTACRVSILSEQVAGIEIEKVQQERAEAGARDGSEHNV